MAFIRNGRPPASGWWLVPIGVVMVAAGFGLVFVVDGDYASQKLIFGLVVGGIVLIVAGIVSGVRGDRRR